MALKIGLQPNLFLQSPIDEAVKQTLALNPDCIEIVYEIPQFNPSSQLDNKLCEKMKETLSTSKAEPSVHSSFFELNLGSQYQETRKLAVNQVLKGIFLTGCQIADFQPPVYTICIQGIAFNTQWCLLTPNR